MATPLEQRCRFVSHHCEPLFNFVNYIKILECYFGGSYLLFLPVLGLVFVLQVRLLDHIANKYTSQSLEIISKKLKLSEALAGATLLAFANGATDIFTSIVSALDGSIDNDLLAVGSIFGSCSFCITVVLYYVVKSSSL